MSPPACRKSPTSPNVMNAGGLVEIIRDAFNPFAFMNDQEKAAAGKARDVATKVASSIGAAPADILVFPRLAASANGIVQLIVRPATDLLRVVEDLGDSTAPCLRVTPQLASTMDNRPSSPCRRGRWARPQLATTRQSGVAGANAGSISPMGRISGVSNRSCCSQSSSYPLPTRSPVDAGATEPRGFP